MIDESDIRPHYSAEVQLFLEANGQSWRLAKVGPGRIVPRDKIELEAGPAEILMIVDGQERRWSVYLVDGIVPFDTEARTVAR
ncbi:hypothetical protein Pan258_14760 [Symmachiella dynata]|uniref:hypothetical protein n=1 Tax=Symmachiella dynata TaxID=2527995 RepID=UPI00118B3CE6|nr:hypothetical protein [Symmachiella dynata]QDT47441.1 hypothetical protein Pan258_14760 [Symmachiella dynata]